MGAQPGRQKEQPITQEQVRLANDLFRDIVNNGVLPETFTPLNVDEIGMDGHKTVLRRVLAMFGTNETFSTELEGKSLPEPDRSRISQRYDKVYHWIMDKKLQPDFVQIHYPINVGSNRILEGNYSMRMHALIMAHSPVWNEEKSPVWDENCKIVSLFMMNMLGPTLKLNFKAPDMQTPGDYNLLVSWAFKNVDKIKQLYFDRENPDHIDTQLARGNGVQLDKIAFETLDILLDKDVKFDSSTETTPIGKAPLSNAERAVAPNTSIVLEFENWFVGLDQRRGREAFRQLLPSETVNDLNDEAVEAYFKHLNLLSLLNLAILKDIPGKSEPIKRLDAKLGFGGKMQEVLRDYLTLVQTAQEEPSVLKTFREDVQAEDQLAAILGARDSDERVKSMLNSIHPEWGNHTLASALKLILEEMAKSEYLGAGSGRALLVQYNEIERTHGVGEHRMVHYMGMMVKLAKYEGKFVLDKYLKQIYE